MAARRILLIISGGIAAYKALDLTRRLREHDIAVRIVLTRAAEEFITPLSATVLSGREAMTALFSPKDEAEIGHIELSREADLIVVAPATADIMARMAAGRADDLATAVLLATDTPVMAVPAMNVRMWQHPATERNIAQLRADGVTFVGPDEGDMACGEFGPGRMADVPEIVAAVLDRLGDGGKAAVLREAPGQLLKGRRVLVTSGPTHEPIDPVRYLANRSSGKQGTAIARAAAELGAEVHLVSGPTRLAPPSRVRLTRVETAIEMLAAVDAALPVDLAVMAAAVADWRVADIAGNKIKKAKAGIPELALVENPDILKAVASHPGQRPELVIGFAAETDNVLANAAAKLKSKGCDWIVANDVSASGALGEGGVLGGDRNRVHLITSEGTSDWGEASKMDVARRLMMAAAHSLRGEALDGA